MSGVPDITARRSHSSLSGVAVQTKTIWFTSFPLVEERGLPFYTRPFSLSWSIPKWFKVKWPYCDLVLKEWSFSNKLSEKVGAGDDTQRSKYRKKVDETAGAVIAKLPNHAILIAHTRSPKECCRGIIIDLLWEKYCGHTILIREGIPRLAISGVYGVLYAHEWDGESGEMISPPVFLHQQMTEYMKDSHRERMAAEYAKQANKTGTTLAKRRKPTMSKTKQKELLDDYGTGRGTGKADAPLFEDEEM